MRLRVTEKMATPLVDLFQSPADFVHRSNQLELHGGGVVIGADALLDARDNRFGRSRERTDFGTGELSRRVIRDHGQESHEVSDGMPKGVTVGWPLQ